MSPRDTIQVLDKQIAANRGALIEAVGEMPEGAAGWQAAWDAHPELYALDCELYRQRGVAQVERDTIAAQEASKQAARARRAARVKAPRKCPTCGCHTLTAAA